eukprot:14085341-Alexandrium_andersonii.AAC.1
MIDRLCPGGRPFVCERLLTVAADAHCGALAARHTLRLRAAVASACFVGRWGSFLPTWGHRVLAPIERLARSR